jgi:Uma2 family endonuclease
MTDRTSTHSNLALTQDGESTSEPLVIDWEAIITEDDAPVDNYVTEQHLGLLTDTLYDSWSHSRHGKAFIVAADVGLFFSPTAPPVVPDVFLSLGVRKPADRTHKRNRSYFVWEVGKPPEVVIEIVSNQEGDEDGRKLASYARLGIQYYAIFDPLYLSDEVLRLFVLRNRRYVEQAGRWMPEVELGLTIWEGRHQGTEGIWLRWCDQNGAPVPTAGEQVEQQRRRAEEERRRAEEEHRRAEGERIRADKLAAKLRALGIEEDDFTDG